MSEGVALPEVNIGIDLTDFYMSIEWDILEVGTQETISCKNSAPVRVLNN